jgi:thiamine pyrophosphate-dependent acetolactate synthase large subunit-like protein
VLGLTVRKARDFEGALQQALASGRPAVIDVVTDMEALAPRGVTHPVQPAPPADPARPVD